MEAGCYTALATPFAGDAVDYDGLDKLAAFQIESGITGILAVGTTGESPTLTWEEHDKVVEAIAEKTRKRCICIAGAGSNNTSETLKACEHAAKAGAEAVLLVDPYYNGPSSLEIRREYVEPMAFAFPDLDVIPYVIPGRTGAQLLPEDLAILNANFKNVSTVKEATGNVDNMKRTRACCGDDFTILSGDDGLTLQIMTDPHVRAAGVISVVSNIAPGAVCRLVDLVNGGKVAEAEVLEKALRPLFSLVTVVTTEKTPYGEVVCRARNPLALKALMTILGMPSGGCRRPLGKMSAQGVDKVLAAARSTQENNPEILAPLGEFFGVDVAARLNDPACWEGLAYDRY